MVLGGAASRRRILGPARSSARETRFLLALLSRGGTRIRVRGGAGIHSIPLISQTPILLPGLGRRYIRERGTDALFAALTPRHSRTCGGFDAGFRVMRGCGVGAWVIGCVVVPAAVPAAAGGGGGVVRVEAAAADAGAEGHEGRLEHGQAGAHDAGVGFDGGPDCGVEGAVDLVGGLGAAVEGRHAEDGGDADAGGGGEMGISFGCGD